ATVAHECGGIRQDPSCLVCDHASEDLLHAFKLEALLADVVWSLPIWFIHVAPLEGQNFIHFPLSWNAPEIIKVSLCWALQFSIVHTNRTLSRVPVQSLSGKFVYLHIDAAVNVSTRSTSASDVVWCEISLETGLLGLIIFWAVKVIQDSFLGTLNSALLRQSQQMLQCKEHWVLRHVPRERNQVVDRLAKISSVGKDGMQIITSVPRELINFLGWCF
ncbi:hypothetical protein Gohar_015151, partial [Gossypium harknessii]|nr:hypothetical protein [Gossypium harknessii]